MLCRLAVVVCTTVFALGLIASSSRAARAELLDGPAGGRIVNGVQTQSRPTTGALLLKFGGAAFSQICTGTLIGCETFLTAAHCVCPGLGFCSPFPEQFAVYLQHGGIYLVDAVDVHPDFDFAVEGDIAVVTLAAPIEGIPPTPINTSMDPPHGMPAVIAGFGLTDGAKADSGRLRDGSVVTAACDASVTPVPEPAHVCWVFDQPLGPPGTDSNTCSGDSGGPMFVDLGSGEVVAGVTSGGEAVDCQPFDVSFDTNVFQHAAFIQGVAGADLLNTSCGTMSQVGDVNTAVISVQATQFDKIAQKCRKAVRKSYTKYLQLVLKARSGCFDDVNLARIDGPCPDAKAQGKIAKAVSKVDPVKLGKRCPAAVVPLIAAGGACAGAAHAGDLAGCIVSASDDAADALLSTSYADDMPTTPSPQAVCQAAIGRAAGKYQSASLKALGKCEGLLDRTKAAFCPDGKATTKVAKAVAKLQPDIEAGCSDADVASLDAAAGFGGGCAGVATTAGLASCLRTDFDAETATLLALLESASTPTTASFVVPPGTERFRVTVNGEEAGGNDVDLYVRLGAPATTSVYDDLSINAGTFEAVELVSPAAGEWFVLVDESSGASIPTQLTVTLFQP